MRQTSRAAFSEKPMVQRHCVSSFDHRSIDQKNAVAAFGKLRQGCCRNFDRFGTGAGRIDKHIAIGLAR
jgi:hypothetical protein